MKNLLLILLFFPFTAFSAIHDGHTIDRHKFNCKGELDVTSKDGSSKTIFQLSGQCLFNGYDVQLFIPGFGYGSHFTADLLKLDIKDVFQAYNTNDPVFKAITEWKMAVDFNSMPVSNFNQ
ncbi:hypothetical protein D5018_05505 [Parashewanella curva]|uniref:Uncharacterized protein n=1 Tax=Parashewanella curva TaxID=2338552 RepID=A0A3L8PZY6_9GAMM|nr:hypothetical protein [Parashewanella curva]RLV60730.1 hypothetical protein D5018_05505 [Parashewanella curva]